MSTAAVQETQTQDQSPPASELASTRSVGLVVGPTRSPFESRNSFDEMVPLAKALASSTVVPDGYREKPANCMIALELSYRTGASVMMVMQNLHIIKNKPSWSSAFLVASVNTCGRFSSLRYEEEGTPSRAGWRCRAYARELSTGDVLRGTWITWEMAQGEGWVSRPDSKWKTMPEQMIRYRAAAFWTRTYAPEISLGMHTTEEIVDVVEARVTTVETEDLNKVFQERTAARNGATAPETQETPTPPAEPKRSITDEELAAADRETVDIDARGQTRVL